MESFSILIEALGEPTIVVRMDGEIAASNAPARALLSLEASAGGRLGDRVVEPSERVRRFLVESARSRSPIPGALTLRGADGNDERRACEGSHVRSAASGVDPLVLVRFSKRAPAAGFALLGQKIEELNRVIRRQRASESELERNRGFLEEAQRIAHLGSWEWDVASGEIAWSDELFRLYGLDPADGAPAFPRFLSLLPEKEGERLGGAVQASLDTGTPFSLDHRLQMPDGTHCVLHCRGRVVTDGDGRPVRMIGSALDVTERHRREEERRFLDEAGRILGSSLELDVVLDRIARLAVPSVADWCAVDVLSRGAVRRVAVAHVDPAKEELAREIERRWPTDPASPSGVPKVIRTGRPDFFPEIPDVLLEQSARGPDHLRRLRELDIRSALIVPLRVRDATLGALTLVRGESGRRLTKDDLALAEELATRAAMAVDNANAYAEARQASRVRDEMVSVVSHDLRGPIDAIAGAADLLLDLPLPEERRRELLGAIKRSAGLMDRLTQDLLDIAQLEEGKLSVHPSCEQAGAVVLEAIELWRSAAEQKGVTLEAVVPESPVWVRFDRPRMIQVLGNLLGNAIKFTPPGGDVTLALTEAPGKVQLTVSDTGCGIPEEEQALVFDRFWRATEHRERGAGLGLAIARGLVETHGGSISLESRVGEGSAFRIEIPLPPDAPAASAGQGEQQGSA